MVYTTAEELKKSAHSCFLYLNEGQKWDTVAALFVKGIQRSDKCMFMYHDAEPAQISNELTKRGLPVGLMTAKDQLEFFPIGDFYYPRGVFDPENPARLLGEWLPALNQHGFKGLTVAGEGDFVSEKIEGIGQWVLFEEKINHLIKGNNVTVVCLYHKKKVSPIILEKLIHEEVHPYQLKPSKKIISIKYP